MPRGVAGQIQKMIERPTLRKVAEANFSGTSPGTALGTAKIARQAFTNATTVTITHNFGDIPVVFVLVTGFPYGMGEYGAGAYGTGSFYERLDESDYTVGYSTDICIVNLSSARTGQVICIG
jgi:hypothetical protein